MRVISKIIVHCSDTYSNMDIGAREIHRWHTKERGWAAIGYNDVIRRDGTLEPGRDLDQDGNTDEEIGAHAARFNANSIGVCMIGGKGDNGRPEANFTMAQYRTLYEYLLKKKTQYPNADIVGHRDLPNVTKVCPVFNVKAFMEG